MTDAQTPPVRKDEGNATAALIGMAILGGIAVVAGAIAGFSGRAAAAQVTLEQGYAEALGIGNPHATDGAYAQMWFGVAFAILGVVLLITAASIAIVRAGRSR